MFIVLKSLMKDSKEVRVAVGDMTMSVIGIYAEKLHRMLLIGSWNLERTVLDRRIYWH